ncbi:glycosyltransferase family 4 protein [Dongia deserti]|uniref:glycosyltransferase family 4 protein n=1 Tax=Dongia deserti TaxID=2268030 RepID=UPI000E65BFEE|nr:glycosyltransferase family 4 protein [Dongia deserti]
MQTVLVTHSRDGLGGSVITGALLAKALDSSGEWKTLSICNSAGPPLDYHRTIGIDVVPLMESQGLPYTPNPGDGNRLQRIAKRITLFRAARRFLKSASPDIIHVHDESSALAWGLAARPKRIPVVWQVHQQLPQRWIDWLLRRLASHIVFVAANNQRRFDGVDLPASSVIYNGVDLSVFYPATNRREGPINIGFISNLVDRKRPEWVIQAAGRLAREGLNVKVLLAGNDFSGGEKARELQDLAKEEGITGRYHYIGPRSDVPDVLRSLDILVLPSKRDKEAFPRIVVEAMACGVPVLATAVAGVPEAVVAGETGLLVDPDDFDGFVGALRTLVTDDALRSRYGAAAVARCRALFSMEASVAAISEVYRSVTAEHSAQQRELSSFA